jgi:hypothetical protein
MQNEKKKFRLLAIADICLILAIVMQVQPKGFLAGAK